MHNTYCTVAHSTFLRDVCDDDATVRTLVADPSGAGLESVDRVVYEFAAKVAIDASTVQQSDVDALRSAGLTDTDIADIVYVVAARCFFTRVIDGLGALTDPETAATFDADSLAALTVGRPVGER